jgi:hypothetical protein
VKKLTSEKLFIKIVKELKPNISEDVIRPFYSSIPTSYIYYKVGYPISDLYDMETRGAFPLLKEIGASIIFWEKLGANKKSAQKLANLVEQEKNLRDSSGNWPEFRNVIYNRLKFYPRIFNFSQADFELIKMADEDYKKIKEEKKKK